MKRNNLTKKEKVIIGLKCANCGSVDDLSYHHIIPLAIGGNDIPSNMVCLCHICHSKLHDILNEEKIEHSALIKFGLMKARKNGKQLGRPKVTADNIPDIFYRHYLEYFNGDINISELARRCKISRPTIYKYISIVSDEM
jgi:hypothetical protein